MLLSDIVIGQCDLCVGKARKEEDVFAVESHAFTGHLCADHLKAMRKALSNGKKAEQPQLPFAEAVE